MRTVITVSYTHLDVYKRQVVEGEDRLGAVEPLFEATDPVGQLVGHARTATARVR